MLWARFRLHVNFLWFQLEFHFVVNVWVLLTFCKKDGWQFPSIASRVFVLFIANFSFGYN